MLELAPIALSLQALGPERLHLAHDPQRPPWTPILEPGPPHPTDRRPACLLQVEGLCRRLAEEPTRTPEVLSLQYRLLTWTFLNIAGVAVRYSFLGSCQPRFVRGMKSANLHSCRPWGTLMSQVSTLKVLKLQVLRCGKVSESPGRVALSSATAGAYCFVTTCSQFLLQSSDRKAPCEAAVRSGVSSLPSTGFGRQV